MATNKPLTPEEAVDMGRRAVGRRALMRTLRDIFSYRNPLRQFMDAYRFNVIRWSASNLKEPTPGKRVRLFLGTRNPLRILRDNFRQNRADLTADWERAVSTSRWKSWGASRCIPGRVTLPKGWTVSEG